MGEELWGSDRELDGMIVESLVREQFSEYADLPVSFVAEGWEFQVYALGDEWLLRFPKRAEVQTILDREMKLVEYLGARLPTRIPDYELIGRPGSGFPYRFGGYEPIEGVTGLEREPVPGSLERLGTQLASILTVLHGQPSSRAAQYAVGAGRSYRELDTMRAHILERMGTLEGAVDASLLTRARHHLDDPKRVPPVHLGQPVLIHNDLLGEHLVLRPDGSLAGIIDWSDCRLGDPAIDFATLCYWGGTPLLDVLLQNYDPIPGPDLRLRARYLSVCYGLFSTLYGVEAGRREYVEAGMRALRINLP